MKKRKRRKRGRRRSRRKKRVSRQREMITSSKQTHPPKSCITWMTLIASAALERHFLGSSLSKSNVSVMVSHVNNLCFSGSQPSNKIKVKKAS